MKPFSELSPEAARRLEGVFFDLDDTFLHRTRLRERAYSSLFRLKEAGLSLVACTGRPASWAELVAMMWPVDAAIAENGALGFSRRDDRVHSFDSVPPEQRAANRSALRRLVERARREIPALVPASDVTGRVSDYTFDIGEHHRASEDTILAARRLAHAAGARTTRSSVHLHFTYDRTDKAIGAVAYLRASGRDVTSGLRRFAFIGDSQNDAPCFSAFSHSVAVANLSGDFSITPRFVTRHPSDEGFIEFAERLVELRGSA